MKPTFPSSIWIVLVSVFAIMVLWTGRGHADAPAGRYNISNDLVYDTKTKLTWQRATAPGTYTWQNASTYCANLSLSGMGWRLPSIKELLTIVDRTRTNPAIDLTAFPGTPSIDTYWSSTSIPGSSARGVRFDIGLGYGYNASAGLRVRCVR